MTACREPPVLFITRLPLEFVLEIKSLLTDALDGWLVKIHKRRKLLVKDVLEFGFVSTFDFSLVDVRLCYLNAVSHGGTLNGRIISNPGLV